MFTRKLSWPLNLKTEHRRHLIAIGVLFICVVLAFPGVYSGAAPGFDDLTRLNVPQRMLIAWFYRNGQFPFWNPYSFGGQPLWAAGQAGPFYLPNILFVCLPVVAALKVSYLFHELIAAVGMYGAIWHICRNRVGAVVAAIAFTTCGFMLGHQIHTQMYDAMSWFPMVFWAMLRLLERVTPWRVCALSGVLAIEVYAGHPQVTFYLCLMVFLYLLLHMVQNYRLRQARLGTISVLSAFVIGLLLSAPQWLPTLDFISYSSRAETSPFFLLQGSMPPAGPVQFLSPFVFGGGYTNVPISENGSISFYHNVLFWEFTCYVGLVVLILACAVVLHAWRKSEHVRNLFIIGVLAFNLCLGDNGLLSAVLVHVPGFDLFRIPARYVGVTDFCVAGLAGIGVGLLLQQENRSRIPLQRWIGVCASLCAVVLVLLKAVGPLRATASLSFWVPFGLCLLIALMSLLHISQIRWFYAAYMIVLAVLDCVTQSGSFSAFILVDKPEYNHPSAVVSYIQQHLDSSDPFARVAALDNSSLSYDKPDAFRIPALNGYDSLEPQWYANHINLTWSAGTLMQQPRSLLDAMDVQYVVTAKDSNILPRETLGVQTWMHWIPRLPDKCDGLVIRFDASGAPLENSAPLCSLTLVSGSHHFTMYIPSQYKEFYVHLPSDWPHHSATQLRIDNQSWFTSFKIKDVQFLAGYEPVQGNLVVNAWFGPNGWSRVFSDASEAVWKNPDTRQSAWVAADNKTPLVQSDNSTANRETWSANTQTWVVNTPSPGYLVLAQTLDPNWRVQVDGKSQRVVAMGDGIGNTLTGIAIPRGKHQVVLRYIPGGLVPGVVLALVGGCIWLVLLVLLPRRRHKKYIRAR